MKKIICEMCDGSEFLKEDGMFVCQGCGMKYSVEEAKKMMIETDESPIVKKSNKNVDNYLEMAINAISATNNVEAENYANKIIELEPEHSKAWLIKGEAAGWQSTTSNNRMSETVRAWIKAIAYASEEDKSSVKGEVAAKYCHLFKALLNLHAGNFAKFQSEDNLNSTFRVLENGIVYLNELTVNGVVRFDRAPLYDEIADILNTAAVDGYKAATEEFGPDHINMGKYQWERFTDACDNSLKFLDKAIEFVRSTERAKTICDNMVHIGEHVCNSCSYKFDVNSWTYDHYVVDYSFTDSAKKSRKNDIQVSKNWKKFFEVDPVDAIIKHLKDNSEDKEIAIQMYWEEHQDEKKALEEEKSTLLNANKLLEQQIENLQIYSEIKEENVKKAKYQTELNSLGLFKGKEKKELQEKISECDIQISELNKKATEEKKPLESEIQKNKNRIVEIENEFAKEREGVPTEGLMSIKDAVVEGKIKITPRQLVDNISKYLPKDCKFDELEPVFCAFSNSMSDTYGVCVQNMDNESYGLLIIMEADSEDDYIKSILVQTSVGRIVEDMALWTKVASLVALTLFDTVSRDSAEIGITRLMFGDEGTIWQSGLSLEYVTYSSEFDDKMLDFKSLYIR